MIKISSTAITEYITRLSPENLTCLFKYKIKVNNINDIDVRRDHNPIVV